MKFNVGDKVRIKNYGRYTGKVGIVETPNLYNRDYETQVLLKIKGLSAVYHIPTANLEIASEKDILPKTLYKEEARNMTKIIIAVSCILGIGFIIALFYIFA